MMFGTLVVLYLFLGGCGAGILFVTASWSLMFHRSGRRSQIETNSFDALKARCYGIGLLVLCLAGLCLLLDLGYPERVFLLFTQPTISILSFGSFALLADILVGGFLAAANVLYLPFVHAKVRKVAEVLCVVVSFLMMAYTGVYVSSIEAVALWNNMAIPALFVLSSLSAGLSVVFIVMPFIRDTTLLENRALDLHRVHLATLVLELIALAAFLALAFANSYALPSLELLLNFESLGAWFFVGLVGLGLSIPLVAEVFTAVMKRVIRLLPVDVLCIAGGLILRFCVVWSGMH